ncbi:MAG: DUF262 domain-containing protein [Candidatus Binataceae bacterium]|nr:DUF262 domain-containing protein [Candidatus Binataceae bacterium]
MIEALSRRVAPIAPPASDAVTACAEIPSAAGSDALCSYELFTLREAVDYAANGTWRLPSFQRDFIWTARGVVDLAESLWLDYPIGPLLLWDRTDPKEPGGAAPRLILDGQHRLTSLCFLFGKRPSWWSVEKAERWNELVPKFEVWFDLGAQRPPFFKSGSDRAISRDPQRFMRFSDLLILDPGSGGLESIASLHGADTDLGAVRSRLDRIRTITAISDRNLMATCVRHQSLADALEIFARLNSQGIRFRRLLLSTAIKATRALWKSSL